MAAVTIVYLLFALSTGSGLPTMTAVAQFDTRDACKSAAQAVTDVLITGKDSSIMLCIASDSLHDLAKKSGMPGLK